MATRTTFPTVEAVFPELAPTLECLKGLIARLSRTDALLWCGRLNLVLSNPQVSDAEQQRYAAACFLPDPEARRRLAAWVRANPDHRELQVFFRGQILELIRWVAICGRDLEGDGSTFEDVATRRVFGQAAIVAGALWGDRVFRDAARVEQAQSLAEKRSLALATLRRTQVENARSTVALVGLGRGWLIWWQYMPSIWPQVDEEFERLTGLTLKQYYCGLAMVFAQYLDVRPNLCVSGLMNLSDVRNGPGFLGQFARFLNVESIAVEEFSEAMRGRVGDDHLKTIYTRPILTTPDPF